MLTQQEQRPNFERLQKQGLEYQQRIGSLAKINLSLRRHQSTLRHIHQTIHSPEYSRLLDQAVGSYHRLREASQHYQKEVQQLHKKDTARLALTNSQLKDQIAKVQYSLTLESESKAAKLRQKELIIQDLQKLVAQIDFLHSEPIRDSLLEDVMEQGRQRVEIILRGDSASRNLHSSQSDHSLPKEQLHHVENEAVSQNLDLDLRLQALEIKAYEKQLLLQELQRTHSQLELKYNKAAGPMNAEAPSNTLSEQLALLEKEHADVITEIQVQIVQEGRFTRDTKELALSEALRKTKRYIAPKRDDLAKKRKAIEKLIPIILSSCENREQVETVVSELAQLKQQQEHLDALLLLQQQ